MYKHFDLTLGFIFSIVAVSIVVVYFSTESNCRQKAFAEYFFGGILRDVYLEIAGVSFRQSGVTSVTVAKLMFVAKSCHFCAEFSLAIDEPKVKLTIFFCHLFHNFPEPLASLGFFTAKVSLVICEIF